MLPMFAARVRGRPITREIITFCYRGMGKALGHAVRYGQSPLAHQHGDLAEMIIGTVLLGEGRPVCIASPRENHSPPEEPLKLAHDLYEMDGGKTPIEVKYELRASPENNRSKEKEYDPRICVIGMRRIACRAATLAGFKWSSGKLVCKTATLVGRKARGEKLTLSEAQYIDQFARLVVVQLDDFKRTHSPIPM
jgi:hypothetical protein